MKVLITGTSSGIGRSTALYFLHRGHKVCGFDIDSDTITDTHAYPPMPYTHYQFDIRDTSKYPEVSDVDILINNAGVQDEKDAIDTNLTALINITEKYGLRYGIKSIVNQASVSAHNGAEFPRYTASKGGVLSYTRWVAKKIAPWGATCNSVSFGGVITPLNDPVMHNEKLWSAIMEQTPLNKWATAEETAKWIYFLAVENQSMSGQDLIIDNLEMLNHKFIWED